MSPEEFFRWFQGFVDAIGEYDIPTIEQWALVEEKMEQVALEPVAPLPKSPLTRNPYDVFGPQYPFTYPLKAGDITYGIMPCGDKT